MSESLFERLGGNEGIRAITNDLVDNHLSNKAVANRFAQSDVSALKHAAATFPDKLLAKQLIERDTRVGTVFVPTRLELKT